MATLDRNFGALYDVALNGLGYCLEWSLTADQVFSGYKRATYMEQADDLIVEKRDTSSEQMSENKLDYAFWNSQRSWHLGEGQQRFDAPSVSDPNAVLSSKGIDLLATPGQATLLPATSKVLSLANLTPAPQVMARTDLAVFVAGGQPNLKKFTNLDASDVISVSTATETAQDVFAISTDGGTVYVGLAADGIHRATAPAVTTQQNFDSAAGWSTTGGGNLASNLSVSAITTNKKEGAAAIKLTCNATNAQDPNRIAWKDFGVAQNFSSTEYFRIWVYPNQNFASGQVKLRLSSASSGSSTNYFLRSLPALTAGVWYEDVSIRTADWSTVGSPNWASIASLGIASPEFASPVAFVNSTTASQNAAGNAMPISKPSGTLDGHVELLTVGYNSGTGGRTVTISGWAQIGAEHTQGNINTQMFYKVAASEPSSYTVTISGTQVQMIASICTYSGVSASAPINASQFSTTANTTLSWPGVTSTVDACYYVGCAISNGTAPVAAGSGNTARATLDASGTTGMTLYNMDTPEATAGAYTPSASTMTTNTAAVLFGIMLAPSATPPVTTFDDFRSSPAYVFAHWSDWDARVVRFTKDQVFAAGIKSGTQWRFFKAAATTTSTEVYVLPDGWTVSDIVSLGGFVYFGAYRNTEGVIYAYDGTNAPFVALRLPGGDQPLKLQPVLGSLMLIGTRRVTSTASAGIGILYRAQATANGTLQAEKVQTFGSDNGQDYGIRASMQFGDFAYFGGNYQDGSSSGLYVYGPSTGAYARSLYGSVSGQIADMTVFKNRRIFTIDGDGVYVEQATYNSSGTITSSVMDWNIDKNKVLLQGEIGFYPLTTGQSVQMEKSLDNGVTWTSMGTDSTVGDITKTFDIQTAMRQVQYRVTLGAGASSTTTPTLKKAGFSAFYGEKPRYRYHLAIKAYDRMEMNNGTPFTRGGPPSLSYTIEQELKTLRNNQTVFDFQGVGFFEEGTASVKARIGSLEVHRRQESGTGFVNVIFAEVVEVPSA